MNDFLSEHIMVISVVVPPPKMVEAPSGVLVPDGPGVPCAECLGTGFIGHDLCAECHGMTTEGVES